MTSRLRPLRKPAVSLLFTVTVLLLAELAVRVWGGAPSILTLQPRIWTLPGGNADSLYAAVPAKRAGTFRIAAFGASTVKGWPLEERYSFANLLGPLFAELRAEREVEVVNLSATSIDAGLVADVVERADELDADLYLVATGHNEFANRIFWRRPPGFVFGLASASHLFRALAGPVLAERMRNVDTKVALRDALFGLENLALEDIGEPMFGNLPVEPWERAPYAERYEANLRRIVATSREHGVPLVFVEPVANLRDYAPFFPTPAAEAAFARGHELLAAGDDEGAFTAFLAARDADGAPVRMTEPMLERLRAVCAEEELPLLEALGALREHSAHGIPGFDTVIDMLHPTANGHARIAEHIARSLVARGLAPTVEAGRWDAVHALVDGWELPAEVEVLERREAHHYLGFLYLAAGNVDAAREQFETAVEVWGLTQRRTLELLARIYESEARPEDAERVRALATD